MKAMLVASILMCPVIWIHTSLFQKPLIDDEGDVKMECIENKTASIVNHALPIVKQWYQKTAGNGLTAE